MTLPASRPLYLLALIVSALLMAAALYLEHVVGLEPCPLCIIQRIALIIVGLICLAAVLHNPGPKNGKRTGARTYGVLLTLASLLGQAPPAARSGCSTCHQIRCHHAFCRWTTCSKPCPSGMC